MMTARGNVLVVFLVVLASLTTIVFTICETSILNLNGANNYKKVSAARLELAKKHYEKIKSAKFGDIEDSTEFFQFIPYDLLYKQNNGIKHYQITSVDDSNNLQLNSTVSVEVGDNFYYQPEGDIYLDAWGQGIVSHKISGGYIYTYGGEVELTHKQLFCGDEIVVLGCGYGATINTMAIVSYDASNYNLVVWDVEKRYPHRMRELLSMKYVSAPQIIFKNNLLTIGSEQFNIMDTPYR